MTATATAPAATRVVRNGFTYVSDCEYLTDPATLTVKVGDRVRVYRDNAGSRLAEIYGVAVRQGEFIVTRAGSDEFGIYLDGERWESGGDMFVPTASTILDVIEVL